jgi:hypothetical protein
VPPVFQVRKLIQWPAPCMNGGATRARSPAPERLASVTTSSRVVAVLDPPKHSAQASAWRHSTPLGMPVVPPV